MSTFVSKHFKHNGPDSAFALGPFFITILAFITDSYQEYSLKGILPGERLKNLDAGLLDSFGCLLNQYQPSPSDSSPLVGMRVKKSSLQTFPSPMQPSPHSQGQLQGQHRRENTNPSVSSPRPLSTGPASKRRPPGFASVLQYFFLPAYAGRSQRCRKICTNPEVLRILFLLSPHPKNPSHNTLLISAD